MVHPRLGPIVFNVLISDLEDGTECTLGKFADDAEPGGAADRPRWLCCQSEEPGQAGEIGRQESREVQQREMPSPGQGRNIPIPQERLGAERLESCPAGKDLGTAG